MGQARCRARPAGTGCRSRTTGSTPRRASHGSTRVIARCQAPSGRLASGSSQRTVAGLCRAPARRRGGASPGGRGRSRGSRSLDHVLARSLTSPPSTGQPSRRRAPARAASWSSRVAARRRSSAVSASSRPDRVAVLGERTGGRPEPGGVAGEPGEVAEQGVLHQRRAPAAAPRPGGAARRPGGSGSSALTPGCVPGWASIGRGRTVERAESERTASETISTSDRGRRRGAAGAVSSVR